MTEQTAYTILTVAGGFVATWTKIWWDRKVMLEDRKASTLKIVEEAKANAEAMMITARAEADRAELTARKAAALLREDQRKTADLLAAKIDNVQLTAESALQTHRQIEELNQRLLAHGVAPSADRDRTGP